MNSPHIGDQSCPRADLQDRAAFEGREEAAAQKCFSANPCALTMLPIILTRVSCFKEGCGTSDGI